jgi:hypothetical protein
VPAPPLSPDAAAAALVVMIDSTFERLVGRAVTEPSQRCTDDSLLPLVGTNDELSDMRVGVSGRNIPELTFFLGLPRGLFM